jgi:hypothetical protein
VAGGGRISSIAMNLFSFSRSPPIWGDYWGETVRKGPPGVVSWTCPAGADPLTPSGQKTRKSPRSSDAVRKATALCTGDHVPSR